jgi:hypothetical protein
VLPMSSPMTALSVFPGVTYSVCANSPSGGQYCAPTNITVNSDTTAEVDLPAGYTISGTATFNGAPAPLSSDTTGPQVEYDAPDGPSGQTNADSTGNYSVTSLPSDSYSSNLYYQNTSEDSSATGVPNFFQLRTTSPSVVVSGGNVTQNLPFTTNKVTVTVKDGSGNPVSGSPVVITAKGSNTITTSDGSLTYNIDDGLETSDGTTGSDGTVALSVFPGVTYSVCANSPSGGQYCAPTNITVNSDTTAEVYFDAPELGAASWSANPITEGQSSSLTIPASDSLFAVSGGEYYIGATDPGIGNGAPMAYDGTNLNASLGSNLEPGTYAVNIRAENSAGYWSPLTTTNFTVSPAGTSPVFTSASTATAGTDAAFSFQVATTGSPAPALTYRGNLPAGLSFVDNGDGTASINGTVTGTAGTYLLAIKGTNSVASATQDFILFVDPVTITSAASDTESYGVPFSFTVVATGSPVPAISRTGGLPTGVTFVDNGNGTATIAGTPSGTASGPYTLTIKAKNNLFTATQTFVLSITKAPAIKNITTKTAHVGTAFTVSLSATGSVTPSLSATGLPSGLTLTDQGNGTATIAGTPATGSGAAYLVTITATNSFGSTTKTFTIKVYEGPVITSANTASATVGSAFSFQATATGYPAPSISKTGRLPHGITYKASTGTFSGTPAAGSAGTYPITITAHNSTGTVTQSFVLTVH